MHVPSTEQLESFINQRIEISIYGGEEEEIPAAVEKKLYKLEHCPDQTHLRFYFDPYYFIAIPLDSRCEYTEKEWLAFDSVQGLHYKIRKI